VLLSVEHPDTRPMLMSPVYQQSDNSCASICHRFFDQEVQTATIGYFVIGVSWLGILDLFG
jgi:hypothetical protein